MHDDVTNPSRLTAPIAGTYEVTASVRWAGTTGDHALHLVKNGGTDVGSNIASATAAFGPINAVSTVLRLVAQNSGASENTTAFSQQSNMAMAFVGP
jgi:hypothetical protein